MSDETRDQLTDAEGSVKWFDPRKGFGFIIGPEGQDIFVHYTVIEGDGFRVLKDGSQVLYDALKTDKGWKATKVAKTGDSPEVTVPNKRGYARFRDDDRGSRAPLALSPALAPLFLAHFAGPGAGVVGFACGAGVALAIAGAIGRRRLAQMRALQRCARDAERMAEMGAMATGLAHEIENPLSTIGLNAQRLSEAVTDLGIDDSERAAIQRRVRTLGAEAERLRDILADFLEYAGEMKLDPREADLNVVVEELADFYMPQADARASASASTSRPAP